jgi:hypothetical protein
MVVKGEGNKSQADKYMAVNNTLMVTNHYRIFQYRYIKRGAARRAAVTGKRAAAMTAAVTGYRGRPLQAAVTESGRWRWRCQRPLQETTVTGGRHRKRPVPVQPAVTGSGIRRWQRPLHKQCPEAGCLNNKRSTVVRGVRD